MDEILGQKLTAECRDDSLAYKKHAKLKPVSHAGKRIKPNSLKFKIQDSQVTHFAYCRNCYASREPRQTTSNFKLFGKIFKITEEV